MKASSRGRVVTGLAVASAMSVFMAATRHGLAQQNPNDPVDYQISADGNYSSTQTGLNNGTPWMSGIAPAAGTAYVDAGGYRLRTPSSLNSITFAGDSLALISPSPSPYLDVSSDGIGFVNPGTDGQYSYLSLKASESAGVSSVTTLPNLIMANGADLTNYANNDQTIAGNIYLVPDGVTLKTDASGDTLTTSVSGGIIDCHANQDTLGETTADIPGGTASVYVSYYKINSNISGAGMLRLTNTAGGQFFGSDVREILELNGSNSFSGGAILDGTSQDSSVYGVGPDLAINTPTALGTGPFTILAPTTVSPGAEGVMIDNMSGAAETLTTNNAQLWYGNFTFLGTNALNMGSGAVTLEANVALNVSANTLVVGGPVSGGYALTKLGAGTLTLSGSLSYTGLTTVSAGTLRLGGTGSNLSGGVLINSGTLALTANHGVLTTAGLSIAGSASAWTGKLDIGNSAVDVQGGTIATLTSQVAEGYGSGTWQGSGGILSSKAAANASHLTAVGIIQNTVDGSTNGAPLYGSSSALGLFSGLNPANSDVLIKYTYYGDTDLSGKVDGSDYSRIDSAFLNNQNTSNPQLTGWFNGDFNYDGVIDGSDYTLIDNAFNSQGASLAASIAAQIAPTIAPVASTSAVPEPTTAGLLGVAAAGLFGRRRRK